LPNSLCQQQQGFGVHNSRISFDPPIAGATSEITLSVNLTCPLDKGDHLSLNMTNFGGPVTGGVLGAASHWQNQISLSGGDGSRNYKEMFNVTWDNFNDILRLEANGLLDDSYFTVVIDGPGNNISLPVNGISEGSDLLMFVSSKCTGELKDIKIDEVPIVGAFSASELTFEKHTPGKSSDMFLDFTTMSKIYAGEEIILHLEGFEIDSDVLIVDENDKSGGVLLSGSHASSFTGTFTSGDVTMKVTVPTTSPFELTTASDYIKRQASVRSD